jgi:hypothetical protein
MMRELWTDIEGWGGNMLPIKDDIDGGSAFIGDGGGGCITHDGGTTF